MNPRLLVVVLLMQVASAHAQEPPRSLLTDLQAWTPVASEGADIQVKHESTVSGAPVLRIDFDFTQRAGYGGAALEIPLELPDNYEIALTVRGEGPANNLELKLVDPQGLNVWWVNRRAFELPAESTRLVNRKRHFQFAWGPSGGKMLTQLGRIELIIAANEGGRGAIWIEDLRFATLPAEKPYTGAPVLSASSGAFDHNQLQGLMEGTGQPWRANPSDLRPWLAVDFGQPRDLGGIVVHRPHGAGPTDFDVEVSDDGKEWTPVRRVRDATSLPSELALPDLQCRWLRLAFIRSGSAPEPAISRIQFLDSSVGASPNALWRSRAARASRGMYPRTLLNEQSFWTVIGQPGDDREAIINEEGMIEVDRRGFSLEPFIVRQRTVLTWADGTHTQSLRDGWTPIPSVVRRHDGIELTVMAFASGEPGASNLQISYTIRNTSSERTSGSLVLGVRPIQVLPPWQDLNITGGWTPIRSIRVDPDGMLVNEQKDAKRIVVSPPARSAAVPYDAGDPIEMLAANERPTGQAAECQQRSASGLFGWEFDLPAGASRAYLVCVPFHGIDPPPDRPRDAAAFEVLASKVAADWKSRVQRVKFRLPESALQFHDTLRATQAYILINHDGEGFQPGSRTYNRSWMRDGSMTSAAMLELGHTELVRRFIDWYAPHQFPSGKVPCVVDRRGADPVNEHDSNGQLLWLIANYHRYCGDDEMVRRHFARVKATVDYIESLRAQRLSDEFGPSGAPRQEPGKPVVPALAFRGLVPESISHEGYSAKPMHSFWDTLFILRGLNDAVYLARVAGEPALTERWQHLADDFRQSIIKSIRIAQEAHGIDYLPGCVELGDFDSTSSTILLWPVDEGHHFPGSWIEATFDRYWNEFARRRDELPPIWTAYTPYELRHVGTFVRMGQKQRAWEALNWFLTHQRPAEWRHWAEVVHCDPATPRMIGDMPHTWCGSDFLNAARAMFVYEDSSENLLVVLAGAPDEWFFDPAGFGFDGLPTEFGTLSASANAEGADGIVINLNGTAKPAGGFEVCLPTSRQTRRISIDQREVSGGARNRIRINTLPATIHAEFERR